MIYLIIVIIIFFWINDDENNRVTWWPISSQKSCQYRQWAKRTLSFVAFSTSRRRPFARPNRITLDNDLKLLQYIILWGLPCECHRGSSQNLLIHMIQKQKMFLEIFIFDIFYNNKSSHQLTVHSRTHHIMHFLFFWFIIFKCIYANTKWKMFSFV